jgi:tetratricopeptide (TPR) repeat protein
MTDNSMLRPILLLLLPVLVVQSSAAQSEHPQDKLAQLHEQHARLQTPKDSLPVPQISADQSLRIKRGSLPETSTSQQSGTNSALDRGKLFSRHGIYKEAMDCFTRAATADPNNPEPYNRRARAEWQLEKLKDALEDAGYAIKLNPDYAEAFCTRAAILNSMGQYQDAIADAFFALDLKPSLREAYTYEAAAYRNLKQYREADEVLAKLNSVVHPESAFDEWAPDVDYTPYLGYVQATVRQHWRPPQGSYGPIVVLFKMHRDGQITDLRINNAGDATADNTALQSARSSAPFQEPPAGTPPDFDVFIVLDPPPTPSAAQTAPAPAPSNTSPGVNWNGTINQGVNLMQRYIPRL